MGERRERQLPLFENDQVSSTPQEISSLPESLQTPQQAPVETQSKIEFLENPQAPLANLPVKMPDGTSVHPVPLGRIPR